MNETGHSVTMTDSFMVNLLAKYPQFFDKIVKRKDELRLQIIYTQIDREKRGKSGSPIIFIT